MNRVGGCHCGSLRYEVVGEPLTCYTCHCTDCQKATGSAFTMAVILQTPMLRVTHGATKVDRYTSNDVALNRHACEMCGTTIWLTAAEHPDFLALRGGTVDDKSSVEPVAHLWFQSALPWIQVSPDQKVYQQQPTMLELFELWKMRQGLLE